MIQSASKSNRNRWKATIPSQERNLIEQTQFLFLILFPTYSLMIASSLPDIFHRANTACLRVQKQGGPFSLHLNSYSTEKHLPSQAGYAPGQLHYFSQNSNRPRAVSSQSIKIKPILQKQNSKRTDQSKSRARVEFKDLDWLQNSSNKPKVGMSVVNISNFPYESSRRSMNSNIDLEDAENIKNKLQNNLSEVTLLWKNLHETSRSVDQIRKQLFWLNKNTLNTLDEFQQQFQNAVTQCFSDLSTMRRDTNSELKDNRQHCDKLKGEMHVCSCFAKDLNIKTEALYQQCLTLVNANSPRSSVTPSRFADFQEISTVRKSSRGATGDLSRRNKAPELYKISETPDLVYSAEKDNKFVLNGKEIDLLNFEEEA